MSDTLTFTGRLVVSVCWCGMRHAIPEELDDFRRREHADGRSHSVYCPLGHSYVLSGTPEVVKERKRREAAEARAQAIQDQLDSEQRSHAATKGQLTKTKKRVANGVCPCCNRHFVTVERHVASKHPGYKLDAATS